MDEYLKALSYFDKEIEIQQKSLPAIHPDLARSYDNIGVVYKNNSKAYSFYERAVQIGKQSLPPDHYNLRQWRKNLENLRKKL